MFAQLFPAAQWSGPVVPFATSQTGVAGSDRFDASTIYFGANAIPDFHMPSGGEAYPGQISLAPYAAIYPGVVLKF